MSSEDDYGLHVPDDVLHRFEALSHDEKYYCQGHNYGGHNSERQSVGDPGHCDICAVFGHVVAHPDYGCGDVQCTVDH